MTKHSTIGTVTAGAATDTTGPADKVVPMPVLMLLPTLLPTLLLMVLTLLTPH